MDKVSESEINEIKLFESKEILKKNNDLNNENYNILNKSSSCNEEKKENDVM